MKQKLFLILLFLILGIILLQIPQKTIFIQSSPARELSPSTEYSTEYLITSIETSISGLANAYDKMKSWEKTDRDFSKGVAKAEKIRNTYEERILEIISFDLTTLSNEELKKLSSEIPEIVSQIREVNDLFEFR